MDYLAANSGDQQLTRDLLECVLSGAYFDFDPVSELTVSEAVGSPVGFR